MLYNLFKQRVLFSSLLALLIFAGCAPAPRISVSPGFTPPTVQEDVYVVPFIVTLAPEPFSNPLFNAFVDDLNAMRKLTGVRQFLILPNDLKDLDPAWLSKQTYVTGEVWGYIENSGCCQTELRAKAKITLFEPGKKEPSVEIAIPLEAFFEHDASSLEREREKLARRMARELSARLIGAMGKAPAP